jgi:uncharacterized protein (TIGR03437 family)
MPVIILNNQPCLVVGASMTAGEAGLYQIVFQVPASMPNGNWPLYAVLNGVTSPTGVLLTVGQ